MIFVLTFLNFAFGTHSNGICLDSRHLVLGLRVQSTSVINDIQALNYFYARFTILVGLWSSFLLNLMKSHYVSYGRYVVWAFNGN